MQHIFEASKCAVHQFAAQAFKKTQKILIAQHRGGPKRELQKTFVGTPWAQMKISIDGGRYLDFVVGPHADAITNFETAMSKFRERAAFWRAQT